LFDFIFFFFQYHLCTLNYLNLVKLKKGRIRVLYFIPNKRPSKFWVNARNAYYSVRSRDQKRSTYQQILLVNQIRFETKLY
jgi:hypothetical protein